jgi:glutamate synthase domain-containing protein 1
MAPIDETKVTLKVGMIASIVAALVIFILNTLWVHNGDITALKTNQLANMKNIEKVECAIEKIPAELAAINMQLSYMSGTQKVHAKVSKENNIMLKKNGK